MKRVTEQEFKAIKQHLKIASVSSTARTMTRSQSCIARIKASKNFEEYKELVKLEHTAKRPRVPLSRQVHNARVQELMALKARGRLGVYKAINKRLMELGV